MASFQGKSVLVLGGSRGMTPQAVTERIEQNVLQHLHGRPHDDVAVFALALRLAPRQVHPEQKAHGNEQAVGVQAPRPLQRAEQGGLKQQRVHGWP